MAWQWNLILQECTGCGVCEDVCQHEAIRMTRAMAYPESAPGKCVGCMVCVQECPFRAIAVNELVPVPERGSA